MKRLTVLVISLATRGWDLARSLAALRWNRHVRSGVVLYYHAVKPHQRRRFAAQMDELLKRASPVAAGSLQAIPEKGRSVAVTFDDGFRSVLENAVPELAKRGIPFTIFVPSGCLGERPSWVRDSAHSSWDERVLSARELRALAGMPLATLGSHSVTHPNLTELDAARAQQELSDSRAQLEAAAGVTVDVFSFPHGAYTAALVDQARHAGYRFVFTIDPTTVGGNSDLFSVGRVVADPDDWPIEFRLKIAGAYRWRHYVHRNRAVATAHP